MACEEKGDLPCGGQHHLWLGLCCGPLGGRVCSFPPPQVSCILPIPCRLHPLYFSPLLLPVCSAATEAEGGLSQRPILSTSPHSCFLSAQLPQKQKVDSLKDPSSLLLPTLASFLLSCHRSRRWLSQRPYSQTLQPSASIQGGLNSFPPPSLSFSGLEYSSSPFVALWLCHTLMGHKTQPWCHGWVQLTTLISALLIVPALPSILCLGSELWAAWQLIHSLH